MYLMTGSIGAFILFSIFILPFILTVINIKIICGAKEKLYEKRHSYTQSTLIYGLILFNFALCIISSDIWNNQSEICSEGLLAHQLFSTDNYILILIIEIVSVISVYLLDRPKFMSPVCTGLCVCGTYAGFIALVLYGIQALKLSLDGYDTIQHIIFIYMWIYIINFYLCSARVLREAIRDYQKHFRESDVSVYSDFSRYIAKTLSNVSGWFILPAVCLIPPIEMIVVLSAIMI